MVASSWQKVLKFIHLFSKEGDNNQSFKNSVRPKGTRNEIGHSKGTPRALGQSDIRALKALGYLST